MILNWASIASLCTISIIAFIVTLLLGKDRRSLANNFLSAFLITLALILLNEIFIASNIYLEYPSTIFLPVRFLGYLLPVLLYLYAEYLLKPIAKLNKKHLFHFIPFLLITIYFSHYSFFSSSEKITLHQKSINFTNYDYQIAKYIGDIIKITYLFLTFKTVNRSKKYLTENYSNPDISKIGLLKRIIYLWVIILVLYQLVVFGFRTGHYEILISSTILNTLNFVIVFVLGIWGVVNPQIIANDKQLEIPQNEAKTKYDKSTLSETDRTEIAEKLLKFLENQKPFCNPDLTIQEIADSLDLSKHSLSEVINSKFQKNFFDLINEFRVNEFIKKLEDPSNEKFTLLSLAFESGFNSKSSFYRIFKNFTGKTPAQYKKDLIST